ncbi:MAG: ABC transporter substrate-binding protein, partial [Motiliproteus sp.]
TTINIAPEHMLQELQQEQVAAISVWEPFAFKAMEQLQDDALIYPTKGLYNLTFNLVAKRSYIQQNPERIRRVLQALERAIQFITENPATSKAIIKTQLSLDDAFIDWIWPDYLFKLSLNQTLLSTLENEARWALENDLVEPQEVPDYRQYIDSAPLVALEPWASTL